MQEHFLILCSELCKTSVPCNWQALFAKNGVRLSSRGKTLLLPRTGLAGHKVKKKEQITRKKSQMKVCVVHLGVVSQCYTGYSGACSELVRNYFDISTPLQSAWNKRKPFLSKWIILLQDIIHNSLMLRGSSLWKRQPGFHCSLCSGVLSQMLC